MNLMNKFLVLIGVKEVVEISSSEPEELENKSEVLVVITEREIQEFINLNSEAAAIKELQDSLVPRLTATVKKESQLWKRLRSKYNLSSDLRLNLETREIRKL